MTSNTKWVVGIIVVIAIVVVLWFAFGREAGMTPEAATPGATTETPAPAPAPEPTTPAPAAPAPAPAPTPQ